MNTAIIAAIDALQIVRDARDRAIAQAVAQTEREYQPRINALQQALSDTLRRAEEARHGGRAVALGNQSEAGA